MKKIKEENILSLDSEMREQEEEIDYGFIDKLLPWSNELPEICRTKTK
ncbi:MAG: hypothetical protein SPF99_01370 [Anaerobutyricum sp.]|nr:hypothetical protein [Anaerobutyricum sp.]